MFRLTEKIKLTWKEMLVSLLMALICLILFLKLPSDDFFQETCKGMFFLVLVPLVYTKLVLKKSLAEFGFSFSFKKKDFFLAVWVLFSYLIIFFCLFSFTDFKTHYHVPRSVQNSFEMFIFFELITFNFLFLSQEIFFKGFLLHSFSKNFGIWSILITAIIYCAALLIEKSFIWQAAPLIIFSFVGSWLAYKNNSIWLAYLTSLIAIILLDSFLIFSSK